LYKKLTIIFAVILLALIADRVIFTSTGVKIELKPEVLRASENSQLEIEVFRQNMLGFMVPFSTVDVRFAIEDGINLVEIVNESSEGSVTIRSKGIEGEAVVGIYSLKSGIQLKKVLVKILHRDVAFYSY
jgi:hypothetical protein